MVSVLSVSNLYVVSSTPLTPYFFGTIFSTFPTRHWIWHPTDIWPAWHSMNVTSSFRPSCLVDIDLVTSGMSHCQSHNILQVLIEHFLVSDPSVVVMGGVSKAILQRRKQFVHWSLKWDVPAYVTSGCDAWGVRHTKCTRCSGNVSANCLCPAILLLRLCLSPLQMDLRLNIFRYSFTLQQAHLVVYWGQKTRPIFHQSFQSISN